jgi:hypothetical protein
MTGMDAGNTEGRPRGARGGHRQRHVRVIAWKDEADGGSEETAFTAEIQPVDAQ